VLWRSAPQVELYIRAKARASGRCPLVEGSAAESVTGWQQA